MGNTQLIGMVVMSLVHCNRVATNLENLEKSGNLKVVRENRKSGKCVLAFGVPAVTLFNDFTIAYVPQIGGSNGVFLPQ